MPTASTLTRTLAQLVTLTLNDLEALIGACPALANVCILLLCVFLIFAILGLSLFMGKFHFCNQEVEP